MQLGVNVPNFGPGTDPGVLREWTRIVEGLAVPIWIGGHSLAAIGRAVRFGDAAAWQALTAVATHWRTPS